jgi:hypothetical protein
MRYSDNKGHPDEQSEISDKQQYRHRSALLCPESVVIHVNKLHADTRQTDVDTIRGVDATPFEKTIHTLILTKTLCCPATHRCRNNTITTKNSAVYDEVSPAIQFNKHPHKYEAANNITSNFTNSLWPVQCDDDWDHLYIP